VTGQLDAMHIQPIFSSRYLLLCCFGTAAFFIKIADAFKVFPERVFMFIL
jgi:hypothetical protein